MAFFSKKTEAALIKNVIGPKRPGIKRVGIIAALELAMRMIPSVGEPFDTCIRWAFVAAISALLAVVVIRAAFDKP